MKHFDYSIRSAALTGLDHVVNELDGDFSALLKQVGLPLDLLENPEQLVSYAKFERVLELGAEHLKCNDFGLRIAQQQDLRMLGAVGLLMESCESFSDAVRLAQTFICTHVLGEYWKVDHYERHSVITRYQFAHSSPQACQLKELSLAVCFRLLRALCGSDFEAEFVNFTHASISDQKLYQDYFGLKVRFNQEHNQIGFSNKFLDQKIARYDDDTRAYLLRELNHKLDRDRNDLVRQVRTLILQTLGSDGYNIATVSAFLGMHSRTLQRRLKQEGTSFKFLLKEIRTNTASWLLQASNMDITLLSQMLGYNDVSAFSRAFSSATGLSPRAWRKLRRYES
jgi:AraC-like DNA-binding protein